jgi:hypothetical protein
MREAREKRIVLPGVDQQAFCLFITYLYGGPVGTSSVATETLVELLAVAHGLLQFDDSRVLNFCEAQLVDRIEDSSVFQLLTVSDKFNTPSLRECSLKHIVQRPELLDTEGFSSLTEGLRQEIRDLLSGSEDPRLALRHPRPPLPQLVSHPQAPVHTQQAEEAVASGASSEDEEELQLESGSPEWDSALDNLRAVLGSEVDGDVLRNLLLIADMDINRAVNYFFNTEC